MRTRVAPGWPWTTLISSTICRFFLSHSRGSPEQIFSMVFGSTTTWLAARVPTPVRPAMPIHQRPEVWSRTREMRA